MNEVAATKLGGMTIESRSAMQAKSPEIRGVPRLTPSPSGQGTDVTPAIEMSVLLSKWDLPYPAGVAIAAPYHHRLWSASPIAVGKALAFVAPLSSQPIHALAPGSVYYYTGLELRLGLGATVIEVADPGDISTTVTTVATLGPVTGFTWLTVEDDETTAFPSYYQSWPSLPERAFEFRDEQKVRSFLSQNQYLISLIMEGKERIRDEFGTSARLILEVVTDPDSEHEEELFVQIRTALSIEQASEALKRLDERWWLKASLLARCKLNFDVEVV